MWSCGGTPAPLSLPLLPGSFSLSPSDSLLDSCSELPHARAQRTDTLRHAPLRRADTLAHTHADARARTPPPAALHNATLVQSACQLSIIHAASEDRAAGAASLPSSSSPNLTKREMMLPRDSAPFAATNYFPGVAY